MARTTNPSTVFAHPQEIFNNKSYIAVPNFTKDHTGEEGLDDVGSSSVPSVCHRLDQSLEKKVVKVYYGIIDSCQGM